MGGTSFHSADLTDANFTSAMLKSTNFTKANLTRTCWDKSKKLDRVRPGTTYLKNAQVRQLLSTKEGQNQNFDGFDFTVETTLIYR
ncbi:MAG: pentapeptide repeat-containing protein [Rhizonema sp. PD38]|nr:pentapeptide repeat-containing protein [Rhizonema sp. PD38]